MLRQWVLAHGLIFIHNCHTGYPAIQLDNSHGEEVKGLSLSGKQKMASRIRSELGMVFQSFNVWSRKALPENIIEAPIYAQGRSRSQCLHQAEALLANVTLPKSTISIRHICLVASSRL